MKHTVNALLTYFYFKLSKGYFVLLNVKYSKIIVTFKFFQLTATCILIEILITSEIIYVSHNLEIFWCQLRCFKGPLPKANQIQHQAL